MLLLSALESIIGDALPSLKQMSRKRKASRRYNGATAGERGKEQRPLHMQVSLAEQDETLIITLYEPSLDEWEEHRRRR